MAKKDPRIDRYISDAAAFAQPILKHIRKLIHAGCPEVEETMKWSMPFFMHKGILCNMAAFKEHCAFGFWKAKLILGKDAADDAMGHFGRITSVSDLPSEREMLGYIKQAVELNESGAKVPGRSKPKKQQTLDVPDYFSAALRQNKKALETFGKFSYSHQKEYVEWVTEAKREETRTKRLETTVAWLTEGKPRHWKYQNC